MATRTRPKPPQARSEPTPETQSSATALPLDVVFGTLSNKRRRMTLRYMFGESGARSTTLSDLAEHIAGIENGKPEEALSSSERKRVYICLYQCHLPKMDDADIIAFDENRKTVELGENAEDVMKYLPDETQSGSSEEGWRSAVGGLARAVHERIRALP